MSIFDIVNSLALGASTMPIPRGSPCTHGAIGNQTTCAIQGFMLSLGLGVPSYNAMLCLYYYCVLQRNMNDRNIERFEPYMHAYAIIPAVITAIIPALFSLYNNNVLFCNIASRWKYEYPPEGFKPNGAAITVGRVLYVTTAIIILLNILIIAFSMISIYYTAWVRMNTLSSTRFNPSASYIQQLRASSAQNTTSSPSRFARRPTQRRSSFHELTSDTKHQAMIYVGGYIITWICPLTSLVLNMNNTPLPILLRILLSMFYPSQGIWNFLGFIRPRYKMISSFHSERRWYQKLLIVVFDKVYPEEDDNESTLCEMKDSSSIMEGNGSSLGVICLISSLLSKSNSRRPNSSGINSQAGGGSRYSELVRQGEKNEEKVKNDDGDAMMAPEASTESLQVTDLHERRFRKNGVQFPVSVVTNLDPSIKELMCDNTSNNSDIDNNIHSSESIEERKRSIYDEEVSVTPLPSEREESHVRSRRRNSLTFLVADGFVSAPPPANQRSIFSDRRQDRRHSTTNIHSCVHFSEIEDEEIDSNEVESCEKSEEE